MKRLGVLVSVVFIAGCVQGLRPPAEITYEDIPAYAWETLMRQSSFAFEYSVSKASIGFSVEGAGTVVLPDALRFKGTWRLGEEERLLNLAAAGDYQLERENGGWVPHPRGEESKILEEADRVIRQALLRKKGKGFSLVFDEGRTLTFSFTPNLAYLDPGFEKKFSAELIVDGRTLIAREIHASSEDKDVRFDFKVRGVNRKRRIDMPFAENFLVTYSFEEGGLCKTRSVVRKRFEDLGRETRIHTSSGMLQVALVLPVDERVARALGEPGELVILGLNLKGEGPQINTRGHVSDIFYIADTVARPKVRSALVSSDSLSRPVVKLELEESEPKSSNFDYLGIAVDGVLYEVILVDKPPNFTMIENVSTYQEALALAAKLKRPLSAMLRYTGQERLR